MVQLKTSFLQDAILIHDLSATSDCSLFTIIILILAHNGTILIKSDGLVLRGVCICNKLWQCRDRVRKVRSDEEGN